MDARLTPSALAIAATVYCLEAYISRASRILGSVITAGRPPVRPRARAAASPALVRPRTRSRSNSASAAKMWNTSLPPEVVVSTCSCSERPSRSKLPHHQRVARTQLIEDLIQRRPAGQGAAGGVDKHPVAAGRLQRIHLQVGMLLTGGDPR